MSFRSTRPRSAHAGRGFFYGANLTGAVPVGRVRSPFTDGTPIMLNRLKRWTSLATRRLAQWRLGMKSETFRALVRKLTFSSAFTERDFRNFSEEAYEKNPYVYAAIRETAQSVASIPPQLFRVNRSSSAMQDAVAQRERKHRAGWAGQSKWRRAAAGIIDRTAKHVMHETGLGSIMARERAKKALVERGDLEPIDSHELLDLLERPNPWHDTSYEGFMQATATYLEIGGEVLWEPIKGGGMPRELYVLSPSDMRLIMGDRERPVRAIELRRQGTRLTFQYMPDAPEETDIFFVRYFHPRHTFRGMSPVQAAARSIDISNEARNWNLSLLQNGAQLSGIITAKETLTDTQTNNLQKQYREQYAGSDNAGKVLAISGAEGIGWESTSATPKEMQWGDLNRATAREVAIVFGVPPEIIGDSEHKTYSNFQEARQAFYKEKVVPLTNLIYGELNTNLVPLFGEDLFLDFDVSQVDALQEDVNEMHERVRQDLQAGMIQINEARQKIGMEPVDGGDVILTPGTAVPLQASTQEGAEGSDGQAGALPPGERERLPEGVLASADAEIRGEVRAPWRLRAHDPEKTLSENGHDSDLDFFKDV